MAAISKEEYLKRYLSNDESGEKKKRRKKVKTGVKTGKSLIIDDDVNLCDIKVKNDSETHGSLLELADENPLIFDETGTTVLSKDLESIRKKEEETKAMWAPLRNFQDEISPGERDQKHLNAKEFSPMRGNARKARHDSPSPERSNTNKRSNVSSKNLKGDINSFKVDSTTMSRLKQQRHDSHSEDISPPRRTRHDSLSDQSPPRHGHGSPDLSPRSRNIKTRPHSSGDQLPARQSRHDSSSDQSPPRNSKNVKSRSPMDQSPPRRNRHDSSSDQSLPRTGRPSENQPKRTRYDSPDISPPRRRPNDKSIDQPPPRRQRIVDNKNHPLHRQRHDSPDLSPRRKTNNTRVSLPDHSPPRKHSQGGKLKGRSDDGESPDQSPPRRQKISEKRAGLQSAAQLRQENERSRQRENEMFARMQSSSTGKGAETVHRDKTGRKRDFKVEEAKKREEEKKKDEENEKFMEWGKGVQQSKTVKDKVQDDLYEMSKPLARYKNDDDLDQMLKEKDRSGDPMLAFMQKKKAKQDVVAGKKEKPKYKGPAPPPNRFNIPPGYRWDGVDRSNGFEKKRFSMLASKGATREEAYKWSIEDM